MNEVIKNSSKSYLTREEISEMKYTVILEKFSQKQVDKVLSALELLDTPSNAIVKVYKGKNEDILTPDTAMFETKRLSGTTRLWKRYKSSLLDKLINVSF